MAVEGKSIDTRATKSGINADMQMKLDANYSKEDEGKAKVWLEAVAEEPIEGEFFEALHDGSYLCRALNKLQDGLVPTKYEKPVPSTATSRFKQIEAIGKFLEGCKAYGMVEKDLFTTLDLYEQTNKNMVLSGIFALGRTAKKNGYEGAALGPKEAEPNVRDFDEQQLREGRNVIGLQMGTNQVASQKGMTAYGQPRQVYDPNV